MKQVSFCATIAYGIIALLSLFILAIHVNDVIAALAAIVAMGLSYLSQMLYTRATDKPYLEKWGNRFCYYAVAFAAASGLHVLGSYLLNG